MRRAWLLLLLFEPAVLFAQSGPLGYFQIAEGRVIWQSVYSTSLNSEDAARRLTIEGFRVVDATDSMVTFYCDGLNVAPEEFGYSRGETPMYVTGNNLLFRGFIQIKDGRYRVTLDRFILMNNITTAGGVFTAGSTSPIESQALNGTDFSSGFKKIPARIYNQLLYRKFFLFNLEASNYLGSDW